MPRVTQGSLMDELKDQILLVLNDYRNMLPKVLNQESTRIEIANRIRSNLVTLMVTRRVSFHIVPRKKRAASPAARATKPASRRSRSSS
jgi:hypothetical protein